MRKINLAVFAALWIVCGLSVGVGVGIAAEPAKPPTMAGFYFEWQYGESNGACVLIQKTDDETAAYAVAYGVSKWEKHRADESNKLVVSDCKEIQATLVLALKNYKAAPRVKAPVQRTIEFSGQIMEAGSGVETVKGKGYEVQIDKRDSKPSFCLFKQGHTMTTMDLPALENFIKILPGVPAAVKLVDEKIGAAVK